MADLEIRIDRRAFLYIAAAALVMSSAGRLATETFTMVTSYPAPSGVYHKLLTTLGAVLARDGGKVGIGTPSPGATLEVEGPVKIVDGTQGAGKVLTSDAAGLANWTTPGGMLSNTVAYFDLAACPAGWTELVSARGRYLVGLPAGGMLGGTAGTALGNLENRPVGKHVHGVSDPGHSHNYLNWNTVQSRRAVPMSVQTDSAAGSPTGTSAAFTGISIDNAGAAAGTNAPYLQLLVCQKN